MANDMHTIKASNRQKIISMIYNSELISKQDIVYALKMSLPTITTHLAQLKEENLILDDAVFESSIGRKAKGFRFNSNAKAAVGIEITTSHVEMVALNLKYQVTAKKSVPFRYYRDISYVKEVQKILKDFVAENQITEDCLLGISVAAPCITSYNNDEFLSSYILDLKNFSAERIRELTGCSVRLFNSPKAAAICEYYSMADKRSDMLYLWIDRNIGAAAVMNGELYKGSNGRDCEISHLEIVPDGKLHYCGHKGCFGAYCEIGQLTQYSGGSMDAFYESLASNEDYQKIWNSYLEYLSRGINALRTLFDMKIVLGGVLSRYLQQQEFECLKRKVEAHNRYYETADFLSLANVRDNPAACGAAGYWIAQFLRQL